MIATISKLSLGLLVLGGDAASRADNRLTPAASAERPIQSSPVADKQMNIGIRIGDEIVAAALDDNATAKDFLALLPLNLTLTDYAGTEKISDLPRRLTTDGMPSGYDPAAGDIAYYAPWGNLAVFYRNFRYSSGLIKLGRVDPSSLPLLIKNAPLSVTIERMPASVK